MRWKTRSRTHGFQRRVWLWRKNEICGYLGFFFEGNAQIWVKFEGKLTYFPFFPRTGSKRIRLPQNEGVLPQNQQENGTHWFSGHVPLGRRGGEGKKAGKLELRNNSFVSGSVPSWSQSAWTRNGDISPQNSFKMRIFRWNYPGGVWTYWVWHCIHLKNRKENKNPTQIHLKTWEVINIKKSQSGFSHPRTSNLREFLFHRSIPLYNPKNWVY